MNTIKEKAIETLSRLPDDVDMNDIMYHLYVLDKIEKGLEDIKWNRTYTHEEIEKEIETW